MTIFLHCISGYVHDFYISIIMHVLQILGSLIYFCYESSLEDGLDIPGISISYYWIPAGVKILSGERI